jgi:hypothetical protein
MWRDVAMTTRHGSLHRHGPFDRLTSHLAVLARGPAAERLLCRLSRCGLQIEGNLVTALVQHDGDGDPEVALIEGLAHLAPRDELAALSLVQLLRPRLEPMAVRLARPRDSGSMAEAEADVICAAWETITRRPPPDRAVRLDFIWNTARTARGVRRLDGTDPMPTGFDIAGREPKQSESSVEFLDAALSAGVLTDVDVVIIVRTRLGGESLVGVARDLGRPYDAVRMARRRSETKLRTYVASASGSSGSSS